jgi:large subunit ribosomal protein L32e
MVDKQLIEAKKVKLRKNPHFRRQDAHKKGKVSRSGWRKPRGHQSKIKHSFKGYGVKVRPGYGTPVELRHMTRAGLLPIRVFNVKELETLTKDNMAVLGSSIGLRNKIIIATKAKEKGIVTIPTLDHLIKRQTAMLKAKEAEKKASEEKQKKKTIDDKLKKPKEEKKAEEPELNPEEKKEQEKKEMDKALISKEQ